MGVSCLHWSQCYNHSQAEIVTDIRIQPQKTYYEPHLSANAQDDGQPEPAVSSEIQIRHRIRKGSPGDGMVGCCGPRRGSRGDKGSDRKARYEFMESLGESEEAETCEENRAHSNEDYLGHQQHVEAEGNEIHAKYWIQG
jgi:hypothetical protein